MHNLQGDIIDFKMTETEAAVQQKQKSSNCFLQKMSAAEWFIFHWLIFQYLNKPKPQNCVGFHVFPNISVIYFHTGVRKVGQLMLTAFWFWKWDRNLQLIMKEILFHAFVFGDGSSSVFLWLWVSFTFNSMRDLLVLTYQKFKIIVDNTYVRRRKPFWHCLHIWQGADRFLHFDSNKLYLHIFGVLDTSTERYWNLSFANYIQHDLYQICLKFWLVWYKSIPNTEI